MDDSGEFVHLHVYSEYTFPNGYLKIDEIVARAVKLRMAAVVLTDRANMQGTVEFYVQAREAGIKPVIGLEVQIACDGSKRVRRQFFPFILLARNNEGYRNLLKISSIACLKSRRLVGMVTWDEFCAHSKGLIGLTGGYAGEVSTLLLQGKEDEAGQVLKQYRDVLGNDSLYIELQKVGIPGERRLNSALARISKETDLPLVATNPCYYLRKEDSWYHDLLWCIRTRRRFADKERERLPSDSFYMKTPGQMMRDFQQYPKAIRNTQRIADECNVEIDLNARHIPLPLAVRDSARAPIEILRDLTYEGASIRYGEIDHSLCERIEHELDVIETTRYAASFLVAWDLVREIRQRNMSHNIRGVGNSSVVAYCIGITDIDPLKHHLYFERLLNPELGKQPEFDVDVPSSRRREVVEYLKTQYGDDNVARMPAFRVFSGYESVRSVSQTLGLDRDEVRRLAGKFREVYREKLTDFLKSRPDLTNRAIADNVYREILRAASAIQGRIKKHRLHLAGIVISDMRLADTYAVSRWKTGETITQCDFRDVGRLGILKLDILALEDLDELDATLLALRVRGINIDLARLPLDDRKTFELLGEGQTESVFQFQSKGMMNALQALQPDCIADLVALIALYRPGLCERIPEFIDLKQNAQVTEFVHPGLEPILRETYGMLIYQEQVMQIAYALAGMPLADGDVLRRALAKRDKEKTKRLKKDFLAGARSRGVPSATAKDLLWLIEAYSPHAFNKAHVVAYAVLAYKIAYLKAHYPHETDGMDQTG